MGKQLTMLLKQSLGDFLIKSLSGDVTTFEISRFSFDLMNTGRISMLSIVSGELDEFDDELVSVVMVDDESSDDSISLILTRLRTAFAVDSLSQSCVIFK